VRKGGGCFDDGGGGDGGCFELRAADDATPRWTTRRSFAPAGGYDLNDGGGEGGGDASDEDLDEKPSGPAEPTRPVRSLASLPAGSCYSSPRSRRWAWRRARTRCPCPRCCSSPHHHARCFHYYYPLLLHLSGSYCGFLTMPDAPGYCCSRSCHFSHGRYFFLS